MGANPPLPVLAEVCESASVCKVGQPVGFVCVGAVFFLTVVHELLVVLDRLVKKVRVSIRSASDGEHAIPCEGFPTIVSACDQTWCLVVGWRGGVEILAFSAVDILDKGFSCPTADSCFGSASGACVPWDRGRVYVVATSRDCRRAPSRLRHQRPGPTIKIDLSADLCSFSFLSSSYLPCSEFPSSRFGGFSGGGLHCTSRSRSSLHCPSGPWGA